MLSLDELRKKAYEILVKQSKEISPEEYEITLNEFDPIEKKQIRSKLIVSAGEFERFLEFVKKNYDEFPVPVTGYLQTNENVKKQYKITDEDLQDTENGLKGTYLMLFDTEEGEWYILDAMGIV